MKYIILASIMALVSVSSYAEGEQSSPNFDCCHTGLCTAKPMCPGVSRKAERRERREVRKEKRKAARAAKASEV